HLGARNLQSTREIEYQYRLSLESLRENAVNVQINPEREPHYGAPPVPRATGHACAIAASVALALSFLITALSSAWADIKIGIIGDQTGAADLDKAYGVLRQGVDAMNREHPDVVLHAGDLVESLQ